MRTTLDINARLLRDAMRRARLKTKTETVERGLEELINTERRRRLIRARGAGYGLTFEDFLRSRRDE
ncbi:MAG: type II toxin-antitoxin system VapB family antitoxin [Candidatus Omnitrophica bacterium]|nr:type II toxin-antitoxin system VapB family antitoxin [Candidatus Omnitrophota bacterium]